MLCLVLYRKGQKRQKNSLRPCWSHSFVQCIEPNSLPMESKRLNMLSNAFLHAGFPCLTCHAIRSLSFSIFSRSPGCSCMYLSLKKAWKETEGYVWLEETAGWLPTVKPMQEVWLVVKNAVRIWLNVALEEENLHRSALWHMLHHESNPRCEICCPIKRLWHCFLLKLGDYVAN